jgi:hypothetical protein
MNIALVFQHKLLQGLQGFISGSRGQVSTQFQHSHTPPIAAHTPHLSMLGNTRAAGAIPPPAARVMPLRVLRIVDSSMPRSSAGRLVISGRMADVCAELDRLVERESAMH